MSELTLSSALATMDASQADDCCFALTQRIQYSYKEWCACSDGKLPKNTVL